MLSINRTYEGLVASDEIIVKVVKLSYPAQMARAESRAREYLYAQWNKLSKQATNKASMMASAGKTAKQITVAVDTIMGLWANRIESVFLQEQARIYKLARTAGHKKATRQTTAPLGYNLKPMADVEKAAKGQKLAAQLMPSFDVVDEAAIKALQKHQIFWMGKFYKDGVSSEIARITKETLIEAGQDVKLAGKLMGEKVASTLTKVKVPDGFHGSSKQYFEGVTANAATVARVHGQMRSFMDIGVTTYQISNPSDHRTCVRCSHMNGKVFTVDQGAKQMQSDLNASNPDEIKASHPWPTESQLKAISPNPGQQTGKAGIEDSKALADAGLALPTFHFLCRCTVDINTAIGSYDQLAPVPTSVVPSAIQRMTDVALWSKSLSDIENSVYRDWFRSGYGNMRALDSGSPVVANWDANKLALVKKQLKVIRESLITSPIHEGEIYRGLLGLSKKQAEALAKKGQIIEMDALSSWSKSKKIAKDFASSGKASERFIVMEIDSSNRTFDISRLKYAPTQEQEVLMEKGKRMRIKKVEDMVLDEGTWKETKGFRVILEEMN
jgi:hypothetical protein